MMFTHVHIMALYVCRPKHRFHIEWDPLLTVTSQKLAQLLDAMDPGLKAVVVEGGLWHIRNNIRKFDLFRDRLKKVAQSLIILKKKRKVCWYTTLLYTQIVTGIFSFSNRMLPKFVGPLRHNLFSE